MTSEVWSIETPPPAVRSGLRRSLWRMRFLAWLPLPFLLWWALRSVPLAGIGAVLGRLNPLSLLLLAAANLAILLVFTSRWGLILHSLGKSLSLVALARIRLAGFAVSYFTPGSQFGGEPLQIYLLSRRHAVPGTAAAASVALDKLFEVSANFTFLAVGLLAIFNSLPASGWPRVQVLAAVLALLALPLAYLLALRLGALPLARLLARLPARLAGLPLVQKAIPLAAASERQVAALLQRHPLAVIGALLISVLSWLLSLGEYLLMFALLGQPLSPLQALAALTAARLAFLLPVPGGLGALEASQVLAMQTLGLDPALGISASLLIRARDLSLGALGFWFGARLSRPLGRPHPSHQPAMQSIQEEIV